MIGVIFATYLESDPFLNAQDGPHKEPVSGSDFRQLRRNGHDCVVCVTGMGPKRAEQGIRAMLERNDISCVINAGVAGGLSDDLRVGFICVVRKVSIWPDRTSFPMHIPETNLKDLKEVELVTVREAVFDDCRRKELSEFADIVDMECGVIARECSKAGISCCAIKGITDHALAGHKEILVKNLHKVAESIVPFLDNVIHLWPR